MFKWARQYRQKSKLFQQHHVSHFIVNQNKCWKHLLCVIYSPHVEAGWVKKPPHCYRWPEPGRSQLCRWVPCWMESRMRSGLSASSASCQVRGLVPPPLPEHRSSRCLPNMPTMGIICKSSGVHYMQNVVWEICKKLRIQKGGKNSTIFTSN